MRLSNAFASVALAASIFVAALPALAASPLAALPIGSSVGYHIASQSNSPDSGPQSATHNVSFMRTTPTSTQVTIDGSTAGSITIGTDGGATIPDNLKKPLAPFGEMALYMRGAPKPPSQGAGWAATLPVPIKGHTVNVPITLTVTQLGANGATIAGSGSASTDVQPLLRDFPATVSVSATMHFTAQRTLSSATSTVTIDVKVGRFRDRQKSFGSSWTVTPLH
jgi:hypothetical protein